MRLGLCIFDLCTFGNILIGFLLGVVASYLATKVHQMVIARTLAKQYGKLTGKYTGYEFHKDSAGTETSTLNTKSPSSDAEIEYLRANVLSIIVTERNQTNEKGHTFVWEGEITMEHEASKHQYGTVVFRYTVFNDGQHKFGFKRCIVSKEDDKMMVFLIGEDGYRKELLIRLVR